MEGTAMNLGLLDGKPNGVLDLQDVIITLSCVHAATYANMHHTQHYCTCVIRGRRPANSHGNWCHTLEVPKRGTLTLLLSYDILDS